VLLVLLISVMVGATTVDIIVSGRFEQDARLADQEEDKGHTTDNSASYAITNGVNVLARGASDDENRKVESCPVNCFRADPVCGSDKVTYWCGAAEAKCAGVDIAHDGYCDIWEGTTNIGSTTALHAAQSLQLVHILWLLVAGLMIVFGNVP